VTRCLRRLHETPTQWQKDVAVVQLSARTPRGSASSALKANRAARSVSLPLVGVGLGEENEIAENRTSRKMGMRAQLQDDGAAIELAGRGRLCYLCVVDSARVAVNL
jgi:hypothetical protein